MQDVRADGCPRGPGRSPRAEDAAQRQGLKKSKEYPVWRDWIQAGFQEQEESQGCSSQSQASPVTWAQVTGWLVPVLSPECWPGPLEDCPPAALARFRLNVCHVAEPQTAGWEDTEGGGK